MKNLKYLNGVLTVIAVCLVLLTLSVVGVIPKATASVPLAHFATVPVNADGSINVKLVDQGPMNVNVAKLAGYPIPAATPDEADKKFYLRVQSVH